MEKQKMRHDALDREDGRTAAVSGAGTDAGAMLRTLEEDIVFGRLYPRERLIEEDLAARFQAKRHVVRQVIADLERMGLVERSPNRGAWVKGYTPEDVEQLYTVRELLEPNAAALIPADLTNEALEPLRAVQRRHDAAVEAQDPGAIFRANVEFHRILFGLTGNRYLTDLIDDIAQRVHGIRFYTLTNEHLTRKAQAEHQAMIAALEAGDRDALIRLCRDHLRPSKDAYLEAYRNRVGWR